VTTVAGATSITVHCQFTGPDAKPILARDVHGKVRFFGGNLKATYDFAKRPLMQQMKTFLRRMESNDQQGPMKQLGLGNYLAQTSNAP